MEYLEYNNLNLQWDLVDRISRDKTISYHFILEVDVLNFGSLRALSHSCDASSCGGRAAITSLTIHGNPLGSVAARDSTRHPRARR